MKNSPTVWLPAGQNLTQAQRLALAVPARAKPTQSLFLEMLANHLQELINADQQEARWAIEMLLGEEVVIQNDQKHLGMAIVNSDNLMPILNRIDWNLPGSIRQNQEHHLAQILEVLV